MYNLREYAAMIADPLRAGAYAAALRAAIRPGSVVVEIGTGIGVFAIMARQLGARRVIAIEPNDAIAVARQLARDNHVADGIEFIHGLGKDVTLSEPADVVFADLRGKLPVAGTYLEAMIDARRFLAPGGTLIPMVDDLCAAVVEMPEAYGARVPAFVYLGHSVNLATLGRFTTNCWSVERFSPERMLTKAATWARIDYRSLSTTDVAGAAAWTVSRPGIGHGLALWFDGTLVEGVRVSNAPGMPTTAWGTFFAPWSQPVALGPGDRVEVRLSARRIEDSYVWRWDTHVHAAETGALKAQFRQSSFQGEPFVSERLKRREELYVPRLSSDARHRRFVLTLIDGSRTNEAIARELMAAFPERFASRKDALATVGQVVEEFAKA